MATKSIQSAIETRAPRVIEGLSKVSRLIGKSRRTTQRLYDDVDEHGRKHPVGALMFMVGKKLSIDLNDYDDFIERCKEEERRKVAERSARTTRRRSK